MALTPKEEQISISAGLLHSFQEVSAYTFKLARALPDGDLKDEFIRCNGFLDSLTKAEIVNLKNWCNHNG